MSPSNRCSTHCYLCGNSHLGLRPGQVRDKPELQIYECQQCGLVFLSSFQHAQTDLYEQSGMHGETPIDILGWLDNTSTDDSRRYLSLREKILNKNILDFGCGAGGFLLRARKDAASITGVELEKRLIPHFENHQLEVFGNLSSLTASIPTTQFDLITLFHVLEHLPDPRSILKELAQLLSEKGEIVIEVPNANDALLTLYNSEPFSNFTYWSCHLFLFTEETLKILAQQADLTINSIRQVQRYPLSNHLYWLAQEKPGGHKIWPEFNTPELMEAYERVLSQLGKCDTLMMHVSR